MTSHLLVLSFWTPINIPIYAPALGRPLSWDSYGVYALDAEEPLTEAGKEIVKNVLEAELGRAEALARRSLSNDRKDLVPAWTLAQIVRVRNSVRKEYTVKVRAQMANDAPAPVLLYRFLIGRLALSEYLSPRSKDHSLVSELMVNLKALRERCRKFSGDRLGMAVSLSTGVPGWDVASREILEGYRRAHPKGPDVRPLLCLAYLNGVLLFKEIGTQESLSMPYSSLPTKGLEIAESILRDRPKDALGLFYRGRSQSMLGKKELALRDIQAALATGDLPAALDKVAIRFLAKPNPFTFLSVETKD